MSAARRDISQSPDPASGHGMGGSVKNGMDVMPNGPVLQAGDYDQWRSPHSVYSNNASFGPLSSQPAPIPGDYVASYYTTSPYDHHGGWTAAPPAGFYHSQGFSPPVSNHYVDHVTVFGGGPQPTGNSVYYNYFPPAPTNGSDYGSWGGAAIIAPQRSASSGGAGSKPSEFFYSPVMDGYTHYVGTDIVGNGATNGAGRPNGNQQHSSNLQFGYVERGVAEMSVYDDAVMQRGGGTTAYVCSDNAGVTVGHQPTADGIADYGQNVSLCSEPKKKSWATIASQPAKKNTASGALLGKSRGRVPIGGLANSSSPETGDGGHALHANDGSGGFWGPLPAQNTASPPFSGKQKQQEGVCSPNATKTSQASDGGGFVRNSVNEFWSATSASSGKSTKPMAHVNVDGVDISTPVNQVINGGDSKAVEISDDSYHDTEKTINSKDSYAMSNSASAVEKPIADKLTVKNGYNPKEFSMPTKGARYFVIKSYSEDDIHRSIKYGIWCSTDHGNKRLDAAYSEREGKGPIYLLFSVNGSGHFCGVAQMMSPLDYTKSSSVWAQDKWKGQFTVAWIYVKDVPNAQMRHIRLENNENKPVTNSRDTQEVPTQKGQQVLKIIHQYRHTTSLFDDFSHYEKRQEEENMRKARRMTAE